MKRVAIAVLALALLAGGAVGLGLTSNTDPDSVSANFRVELAAVLEETDGNLVFSNCIVRTTMEIIPEYERRLAYYDVSAEFEPTDEEHEQLFDAAVACANQASQANNPQGEQ